MDKIIIKLLKKKSNSLNEEVRALKRMGKTARRKQRLSGSWISWFNCSE